MGTVTAWARRHTDIRALALVGSYARGSAGPNSDIDLILLTTEPDRYRTNHEWLHTLTPAADTIREQQWGPVTEHRRRLPSGLQVEFGITTPTWAALPLDPGTYHVLHDGALALHDPERLLTRALTAATSHSLATTHPDDGLGRGHMPGTVGNAAGGPDRAHRPRW